MAKAELKIFPVRKSWLIKKLLFFAGVVVVLIAPSINAIEALSDGTFFEINPYHRFAPLGLISALLIIIYVLPVLLRKNQTLKIDQTGIHLPVKKPKVILWKEVDAVKIKDKKVKTILPYTYKDWVYLKARGDEIWLPPKYYSTNAKKLEATIKSFWRAAKHDARN